jgi:hypothetical protein
MSMGALMKPTVLIAESDAGLRGVNQTFIAARGYEADCIEKSE